MSERDEACWFCNQEVRTDPPPGGWLIEDSSWRASHVPAGYGPAGSVILETRRHVLDQSGFDEDEAATCARVTGRLVAAIREVTGCDRVYQWATMDGFPHFHVWLVPWSLDDDLRGPRFLADRLVTSKGCDAETAERTAASLRRALGAGVITDPG
jgi:diadenosine tetraphosphate (Ap4A) HIT family hydrolase